jgi:hypothetical protein
MLWKSVTALIVLFWVVMTTLLVRHTYFPKSSGLVRTPVNQVLDLVAHQRQITRSTMSVLHKGQRAGNADLAISEWREPAMQKSSGYHFQAGGALKLEGSNSTSASSVTWRFDGDLKEEGGWNSMALAMRTPATNTSVFIGWKQGDAMPKIEVWRDKELIMDTKAALEQARNKQGAPGLGMMGGLLPSFMGSQSVSLENFIQLQAQEGVIHLAGKPRKGYILTLSLMGFYQAKAFYTEVGELTRVELPQGWSLMDPLLEGLDATTAATP